MQSTHFVSDILSCPDILVHPHYTLSHEHVFRQVPQYNPDIRIYFKNLFVYSLDDYQI